MSLSILPVVSKYNYNKQRVCFIPQFRMCNDIKSREEYILYHEANRTMTKSCQWNDLCHEAGCFILLNPEIFSAHEVFEIEYIPLIFHLYTKINFLCDKIYTL